MIGIEIEKKFKTIIYIIIHNFIIFNFYFKSWPGDVAVWELNICFLATQFLNRCSYRLNSST